MPHSLDQLLPSLQSMGLWTYWILALFAMLEAIVLTGVIAPGALAVIAGGMLVQRGAIDFFDLAWFVAAGTIIGSEISFRLGRLATQGLRHSTAFAGSTHTRRAKELLERYGGFAMVVGRFFGPLSAFVPFSAAMAGMSQRKFTAWNIASALPYALILPAIGYFFGSAIGTLGAAAPRILAVGVGAAIMLGLLWFIFARVRRFLPVLAEIAVSATTAVIDKPAVQGWLKRHPRLTMLAAARLDTAQFLGLTTTVLVVLFLYLLGAYIDSVTDFLGSPDVLSADTRIANLLYALRDPRLIAFFGWITTFGGAKIVVTLLGGATSALLALRRFDLLGGLWIAAVGNQISVMLLKSFFARPRSALGYFTETSGSFPSGHAAAAVAIWGMMLYLAWRCRLLSITAAGFSAIAVAFLIGLSRVYLIEHYLSDVLNGYLIGGLWLILGIAFCEWRRDRSGGGHVPSRRAGLTAAAVIGVAALAAIALAFAPGKPQNTVTAGNLVTVADPVAAVASGDIPARTETLVGDPRQTVNVVFQAPDATALTTTLQSSGWTLAPRQTLATLARAFWADWTGATLPDPLVIATFWNDRPTALSFARPGDTSGDSPRLHLRVWETPYRTPDGTPVFLATLTREDPLDWVESDSQPVALLPVAIDLADLSALQGNGVAAFAIP